MTDEQKKKASIWSTIFGVPIIAGTLVSIDWLDARYVQAENIQRSLSQINIEVTRIGMEAKKANLSLRLYKLDSKDYLTKNEKTERDLIKKNLEFLMDKERKLMSLQSEKNDYFGGF